MPIDPAGTKPGLAPVADEPKKVLMRCKRTGCDSIEAVEQEVAGTSGRHLYRCVKCHHPHSIQTGGTFP